MWRFPFPVHWYRGTSCKWRCKSLSALFLLAEAVKIKHRRDTDLLFNVTFTYNRREETCITIDVLVKVTKYTNIAT